jgi:citrate lyase subunit beta/citryl-CoA lyase
MYGRSIRDLFHRIMDFYEIEHVEAEIVDQGALEFVLAARIEAAVRKIEDEHKRFLLPIMAVQPVETGRSAFRFSRLYLPGNTPSMMLNAGIHKPNGVILDLEDSVAPDKKFEAAILVRNALRAIDFYGAERMVRINQFPDALEDLKFVVPHGVNLILVPKCESAEQIWQVVEEIKLIRAENPRRIHLMPIIESALGVEHAFEIASASDSVVAMAIGLEDLTADLGVARTQAATESLYARLRVVNACKAAGIQAIDSVYSDVADIDGLAHTIEVSRSLGFEGMGCIHPRQIEVIHTGYAPTKTEIEKAQRIVMAYERALEQGLGVVSLGSKMIDAPVVKRAQRTVSLAENLNLIETNWRTTL